MRAGWHPLVTLRNVSWLRKMWNSVMTGSLRWTWVLHSIAVIGFDCPDKCRMLCYLMLSYFSCTSHNTSRPSLSHPHSPQSTSKAKSGDCCAAAAATRLSSPELSTTVKQRNYSCLWCDEVVHKLSPHRVLHDPQQPSTPPSPQTPSYLWPVHFPLDLLCSIIRHRTDWQRSKLGICDRWANCLHSVTVLDGFKL